MASSQFADQPLVIDMHGLSSFTGGEKQGFVVSMAPPDEGVKKLCAVAAWNGAIDAKDVTKRLEQLLIKCHMDGLIPRKDQGLGPRLTTTGNKIGIFRKNELWLPVKPPRGKKWLDHLVKVCTNQPAKNTTFYQLKDSPYTWYSPWADLRFDSNFREKGYDAIKPRVDADKTLDWTLGNNLFDPNTFSCNIPIQEKYALAIDQSSAGEISVSKLALNQDGVGDGLSGVYAVGKLENWPLTNEAVDKVRRNMLTSLQASEFDALDPLSFRLLISSPGNAEVWICVARP